PLASLSPLCASPLPQHSFPTRRSSDLAAALEALAREFEGMSAGMSVEKLGQLPYLLVGTPEEIAEQVRAHRARYGIGYFTVFDDHLTDFAGVLDRLR